MSGTETRTDDDDIRFARYDWYLKLSDMREVVSYEGTPESLDFFREAE